MQKNKLLLVFLISITGCRSTNPNQLNDRPTPKDYTALSGQTLPLSGQNTRPRFSYDGQSIYYVSSARTTHKNPQAYVYDLKTLKERRLTYQDGEVYDVVELPPPSDKILYSSSTDEIKERPQFIRQALEKNKNSEKADSTNDWKNFLQAPLPPTDIYLSSREGRDITRLVDEPGFDGDLAPHPLRPEVAFISVRGGQRRLWTLNMNTRQQTPLTAKTLGVEDESPQFSPDGKKILWVRSKADRSGSDLWIADRQGTNAQILVSEKGFILAPTWHPNGLEILFISNRDEDNNFEIYIAQANGSCLRRLTYHSGHENFVQISPDGKKILFARTSNGAEQLFLADLTPPPCPAAANPVQSGP